MMCASTTVVLSVMPRLKKMNQNVYEAALDLGATPFQALRKIILPEIFAGMITGFILAFTLSIDDFAVTIFTIGNQGLETLSTYIYADARKGEMCIRDSHCTNCTHQPHLYAAQVHLYAANPHLYSRHFTSSR